MPSWENCKGEEEEEEEEEDWRERTPFIATTDSIREATPSIREDILR